MTYLVLSPYPSIVVDGTFICVVLTRWMLVLLTLFIIHRSESLCIYTDALLYFLSLFRRSFNLLSCSLDRFSNTEWTKSLSRNRKRLSAVIRVERFDFQEIECGIGYTTLGIFGVRELPYQVSVLPILATRHFKFENLVFQKCLRRVWSDLFYYWRNDSATSGQIFIQSSTLV